MPVDRRIAQKIGLTAVLKLLQHREMYSYELVLALSRQPEGLLTEGQSAIYPWLYVLENKGLVSGRWEQTASATHRRYYRLTPRGQRRLARDCRRWQAVDRALAAVRGLVAASPNEPARKGALA